MTIYKVYVTEYTGGIGDSEDIWSIGYYSSLNKAIIKAKEASNEHDAKEIVIEHNAKYIALAGEETSYPFKGVVIETIDVEE